MCLDRSSVLLQIRLNSSAYQNEQYKFEHGSAKVRVDFLSKDQIFEKLDEYIQQIGFDPVESGQALMRFGSKNENQTYMMPEEVQQKYSMDRFIVLQVISHQNILVGVFDPEWGLTLPSAIFRLNEVKQNIPKTLNMFRKHLKKRETHRRIPENHKTKRLLATNAVIISTRASFTNKPH